MKMKASATSAADRLLTTADVAEQINRPEATLRWWRHLGIGPKGFRQVGKVMYRQSEVDSWLAEQERQDSAILDRAARRAYATTLDEAAELVGRSRVHTGTDVTNQPGRIEDLHLTQRAYNSLKRDGIQTISDLTARSEKDLLDIPNFGPERLADVVGTLADLGLALRAEDAGQDGGVS